MLQYMEQKYHEKFTLLGPYGGQIGKPCRMVFMSSERFPKAQILVRMIREESSVRYQDNYPAYLQKDGMERFMRQDAEQVFGACKVFYKIPRQVFPETFPLNLSTEEFLRHPDSQVLLYFYPKEGQENAEAQLEQLAALLTQNGYCIGGVLSYPEQDSMYERLNADNFYREDNDYRACREAVFRLLPSGEFAYLEWR